MRWGSFFRQYKWVAMSISLVIFLYIKRRSESHINATRAGTAWVKSTLLEMGQMGHLDRFLLSTNALYSGANA